MQLESYIVHPECAAWLDCFKYGACAALPVKGQRSCFKNCNIAANAS